MKSGSFRGKPSKSHIIWTRETRDGTGTKRFDDEHFQKWVSHCGFEYEDDTRVDHERGDEPRSQHRCVFTWGEMEDERIELGDEEWSLGHQKTPRTFIEIDSEGQARVKGWDFETILDIAEMRHKGPDLLVETTDGDCKRLNARTFVENPRERQRDNS
ncbi:MAG: hypothetical protein ACI8XM_000655 [Haloarculaceae archaeon]|jgi:hypothetical protein